MLFQYPTPINLYYTITQVGNYHALQKKTNHDHTQFSEHTDIDPNRFTNNADTKVHLSFN